MMGSGSSPLTRGKPLRGLQRSGPQGLIPAHAGKTPTRARTATWRWAHPRSRGENFGPSPKALRLPGSSPLTRGKPQAVSAGHDGFRLIPAHAGKTILRPTLSRPSRAHPRSRGENQSKQMRSPGAAGSSPLTRGKRSGDHVVRFRAGLIPAHAGKTRRRFRRSYVTGAHPRSRGENSSMLPRRSPNSGSSPLTRGKQAGGLPPLGPVGLIPAHAGKTPAALTLSCRRRAHPRSRGENSGGWNFKNAQQGSSPLTRGKPATGDHLDTDSGLIPAHAGKTTVPHKAQVTMRAHPRSRGENWLGMGFEPLRWGSSPLTRGKREAETGERVLGGLIPAHAGKTSRRRCRR